MFAFRFPLSISTISILLTLILPGGKMGIVPIDYYPFLSKTMSGIDTAGFSATLAPMNDTAKIIAGESAKVKRLMELSLLTDERDEILKELDFIRYKIRYAVYAAYQAGVSKAEIARKCGISGTRVKEFITRCELDEEKARLSGLPSIDDLIRQAREAKAES